jgi:uncharacterized protein
MHFAGLLRKLGRMLCILAVMGCLLLGYAVFVEPSRVSVTHADVPIQDLAPALEGLTLVHISDPHIGVGPGANTLRRAVDLANQTSPDLVLLTGDFLDMHASPDADKILRRELERLQSAHGVYAVLGNHDVAVGTDRVTQVLESSGVMVLSTARHPVTIAGESVWLLGLEDEGIEFCREFSTFENAWQSQADALGDWLDVIPPSDVSLLLVHNPDFAMMLPGHVDLVLAGHTHGGYINLPLLGAPLTPSCFGQMLLAGLVNVDETYVYVNCGLGGVRLRFNAAPEIAVLRLAPK